MGRRERLAAVVAAAVGLLIVPPLAGTAATLPTVTVPKLTVPTLTVPKVTVPSVTTPSVTTPSVSTPSVTTPAVTSPSVSAPSVTVPAVHAPTTPAPGAGSRTGSSVGETVSSVTGTATSGSSSGPARPASPTSAPAPTSSSSFASTSSPAATSEGTGLRLGQRRSGASRGSDPARTRSRARRLARARSGAENRRLRSLLARLRGCLGTLDSGSRRLLSLRAGLHGSPRSAGAVARLLHVTPARERLLERLSLVELQNSAGGPCPGAAPTSSRATAPSALSLSPSVPGLSATGPGSASSGSHTGARLQSRLSKHSRASVVTPAAIVERAVGDAGGLPGPAIVAFAAFVLGLLVFGLPAFRRRLLPAGGAPGTRPGNAAGTVMAQSLPPAAAPNDPGWAGDTPARLGADAPP
jgi:hypothetical protein